MIKVNYDVIPDQLFLNYLDFLIGKVYKCLPMREQQDKTLIKYMESLQRELVGNKELIIELKYNGNFQSILGKLQYLISNEVDIKTFKKDIFDCISLITKLKSEYAEKEELK